MRKVLLKAGKIEVAELPEPGSPGPAELKLRVLASAISSATESAQILSGNAFGALDSRLWSKAWQTIKESGLAATWKKFQERLERTAPLGYSVVGIVECCGNSVSEFVPGDRVAASGAQFAHHAEAVLVSSRLAVLVPARVSNEEAATSALGAIALQGVRRAEPQVGESVVVIGLGFIGQLACQILKASGCKVLGIEKDPARLQFAQERQWIDAGFALEQETYGLEKKILEQSGGFGPDHVLIAAHAPGNSASVELAVRLVRRRGRIVVLGDVGIGTPRQPFYEKELELRIATSYGPGRYDPNYEERGQDYPYPIARWTAQRNMACYLDLIAQGRIQTAPLIQAVYPIEEAEKAFAILTAKEGPKPLLTLLTYPEPPSPHAISPRPISPSLHRSIKKVRVGVIGAGSFVVNVHLPILSKIENLEIAAICNKRPEKTEWIAKQYNAKAVGDPEEILKDPAIDLVLIGTRHNLHAPLAIQAIQNNKAVFLEKPLATTLKDLEELAKVYHAHPVPFHTGFNRRFSPFVNTIIASLQNQPKPWTLQYRVTAEAIPQDHWTLGPEGGGRIVGEACHMVDLIGYLMSANGGTSVPRDIKVSALSSRGATPYHESFSAIFQYEDNKMAVFTYSPSEARGLGKERIEIATAETRYALDDFKSLEVATPDGRIERSESPQWNKGFKEEWLAFLDYLAGRRKDPPIEFSQALEASRLTFLLDDLARSQN